MNKKLNKLVTNYPVELTEEEIENLSATLAPVVAACGGGGGGTGGKIYTGTGYVNVNNTTNQIGLTEYANNKLNKDYVEYNEYTSAIDNRYTKSQTNNLLSEKQDTLEFEYDEDNKVSAINGSALAGQDGTTYTPGQYINIDSNNEISVTGVVAADEYATYSGDWNDVSNSYKTNSGSFLTSEDLTPYSTIEHADDASANALNQAIELIPDVSDFITKDVNDLTNYYKKTQTSSDSELSTEFAKYATTTYVDSKDPVLIGDNNITATSSKVDNHTQWNLRINATPVTTDTTLKGENVVTAHTTEVSGEWAVGLVQSAYEAIDSVGGIATDVATLKNASANWNKVSDKLDTTAAAQTYLEKATYASDSATFLTKTSADNDYAPKTITAAVNTLTGASAKWENASNVVATNSASWNAKVDQSDLDAYLTKVQYGTDSATFALKNQLDEYATLEQLENASGKLLTTAQYQTDSATFALKTQLDDYYKKTDTSSKDELSTEFAKYVTTSLLDTVSSTLNDDIEYVSGQVDNKVDKPTEGNKIFVYQTTGTTTSGWEEIPIELDKSGRNFAIGVENKFVESTTDILLQGYQNSGTYVDFAQGLQNSAFQYVISQGYRNIGNYESMAQGYINTAINIALAQGSTNSANYQAFAQGILNKAKYDSLAQGHSNSAVDQSIAQGLENTAYHYSFAQGYNNKADMQSFAQGADNRASYYSQTIGHNLIASGFDEDGYYYGLFAIGGYNATTSNALFVVGNGSSYNGTPTRSDAFVIYKDGSVSAKGDISANGVKLGGGGTSLTLPVNVGTGNDVSQISAIGAIGNNCSAGTKSFAFSYKGATAANNSFAVNDDNVADHNSFAWGWANTADNYSMAGGNATSADEHSFALGNAVYTKYWTLGVGRGLEFIGDSNSNTGIGALVAGGWNKTTSNAIFVLGNGTGNGSYRRDAVVVDRSGNTKIYGSLTVDVSSGNNVFAVASAATLIGASRQTTEHYGVDTTALGTTWVGVGGDGMHQGFIKYTDGGDIGALDSNNTIQINIKPENAGYNGEMTLTNVNGSTISQSKVVNVPTASYSNMSSFDNTNGPNYMLRKTASGFDIGAAVINVTSLPPTTEANAYYFVYDV